MTCDQPDIPEDPSSDKFLASILTYKDSMDLDLSISKFIVELKMYEGPMLDSIAKEFMLDSIAREFMLDTELVTSQM